MQHLPLAQEQLARVSVAAEGAEGSHEPLVLLAMLCRSMPWGQGSPAQQAPGNAAQDGQQQGTGDRQHSHKPDWWVPHCLQPCDNQWLLPQHLQRQWVRWHMRVGQSDGSRGTIWPVGSAHLVLGGGAGWHWGAPGCDVHHQCHHSAVAGTTRAAPHLHKQHKGARLS